jgi:hypothetical protein
LLTSEQISSYYFPRWSKDKDDFHLSMNQCWWRYKCCWHRHQPSKWKKLSPHIQLCTYCTGIRTRIHAVKCTLALVYSKTHNEIAGKLRNTKLYLSSGTQVQKGHYVRSTADCLSKTSFSAKFLKNYCIVIGEISWIFQL